MHVLAWMGSERVPGFVSHWEPAAQDGRRYVLIMSIQ